MKKLLMFFQKYSFLIILCLLVFVIFRPLFLRGEIPFSANLLVSFFNPWAQEKFPGWEQGIPNKPVGIDDLRIFYPQRAFTVSQYHQGILPFWNNHSFSGNYHAGLSETAIFYPLSFLFLFLPQLPVWIVLLMFEPVAMTIGMYLFLRLLSLKKSSAIFGAITFGFSGLVIVRMVEGLSVGHTLLWIPFILYGVEGYMQKKQLRYLVILFVSLCCTLLSGWFQFAFYNITLGGLYVFWRCILDKKIKQSLLVFLPFVLVPLTTLFHIIPALEAFSVSSRGATTTQELLNLHLMPLSHLLTYFYPDFWGNPGSYNFFGKSEYKESILYIGVVPFLLALFGLSGSKKNKYVLFFSVIGVIGIFLGIDTPVTRSILSLPIPIVSSFLPDRVFYFATVGLSVLSAFGLQITLEKKLSKIRVIFVSVIALLAAIVTNGFVFFATMPKLLTIPLVSSFAFLGNLHLIGQAFQIDIAKHNVYLPDVLLASFIVIFVVGRLVSKKILLVGFFALTMIGQVYFAQKYITFSEEKFVFPENSVFTYLQKNGGINRFISVGNGYITTNSPLFYNLYSPDGVSSMYIERYGQLVTYMQTKGQDYLHIPRVEIRIDPSADEILSGSNPYLLRFMQIDGIKYVVRLKTDTATVNSSLFTKVWSNKTWETYTYKNVLPRIFWSSEYGIEKSNQQLLKSIFSPQGKTIQLEKNPGFLSQSGSGSLQVITYSPNKIIATVNASSDGLVYISDNYVPQWKATVDGKPGLVLRANYSFMAVPVSKGKHTIELMYIDIKEIIAFIIAGVTMVVIITGGWIFLRRKMISW